MNICITTSSFPINSSEIYHRYIDELIDVLTSNGHDVTVLTQDKRGSKECFHKGIEIIWFPWKMTKNNVLAEISFKSIPNIVSTISLIYNGMKYVKKVKREKKIDVFICLWAIPSGFYLFANNFLFSKTKYITWSLGSDIYNYKNNFFTRRLLNKILKGAHSRFADGYELCEIVKDISKKECLFLPTFNEIKRELTSSYKIVKQQDNYLNLLFVGRLSYVKGVDLLIEALNYLKINFQINFKCKIVGDGDLLEPLTELVCKYKLEKNIFFLGKITDSRKLEQLYESSDCLIIPSRSESIPIVLCEALQFNLPMIVTNVGDMAKIVSENELGYVVTNTEPESFSKVISFIIDNNSKLDKEKCSSILNNLTFKYNNLLLTKALESIKKD